MKKNKQYLTTAILAAAVLTTACTVSKAPLTAEVSEDVSTVSTTEISTEIVQESGKEAVTAEEMPFSLSDQFKLIENTMAVWSSALENSNEDADGYGMQYTVTDLDENGRIEIIASQMQGSGMFTYSKFYEVNESGDNIELLEYGIEEGDSQPDIITNTTKKYEHDGRIWYDFSDFMKSGYAYFCTGQNMISLKDGKVERKFYAGETHEIDIDEKENVTYTDEKNNEIDSEKYTKILADPFGDGTAADTVNLYWFDLENGNITDNIEKSYRIFKGEQKPENNSPEYDELAPDSDIARIAGTWYIDGDKNAAHFEVGSDGSFTSFYASGSVEKTGYVVREGEDYGEGYVLNWFNFYTKDGEFYMGFIDDGSEVLNDLYLGNGATVHYVRVE